MPLNISIDVDGTLLDENENLNPQSSEKLLQLQSKGHRLQLWSTGGADYAKKIAIKFGLTGFFESYATKADVAIDDIPESARAVFTLKVNRDFCLTDAIQLLETDLEDCVESALNPNIGLVSHLAEIQKSSASIPLQTKAAFGIKPIPIPFFGNIDHARIVTVGLNPSSTEFAPWREWDATNDARELTFRMVNYFRLAGVNLPPAHRWFGEISESMHILKCPQALLAAHIDFCPWATVNSQIKDWSGFFGFIDEQMLSWLGKTVQRCRNSARLLLIVGTDHPSQLEQNRQNRAKAIIEEIVAPSCRIEILPKSLLPDWTWEHRDSLRNLTQLPCRVA